MHLLIRHGPAPEDTEDAAGELHCTFTSYFVFPISAEVAWAMFGSGAESSGAESSGAENPNAENPDAESSGAEDFDAFLWLARHFWGKVTAPEAEKGPGHGHMLIGVCSGFEGVMRDASCGYEELMTGASPVEVPIAPKDYAPLFAVARAKKPADAPVDAPAYIDLAVDYRGTRGPGDEAIRPQFFAAGDP